MTTIAWDGKQLAADSLVSLGDARSFYGQKIHTFEHIDGRTIVVGGAGEYAQVTAFVKWLQEQMTKKNCDKPVVDRMESIVLWVRDRTVELVELYDYSLCGYEITDETAIGTGWQWAAAAMDHGKDAIQAVEYAITRDLFSDGVIHTWPYRQ